MLHRIQIDFDIEAASHEEAVNKAISFLSRVDKDQLPGIHDVTVIEEGEEYCPHCSTQHQVGNFYKCPNHQNEWCKSLG